MITTELGDDIYNTFIVKHHHDGTFTKVGLTVLRDVLRLADENRVMAIKIVRGFTGMSLKDSKEVVSLAAMAMNLTKVL